ncbi:hypothetical protein GCM10023144_13350 [Pigmentiphaga soli]|uniref:Uncharacterized protein n=1 Tax=Pigmentiphaga soli TaxID=1007095 RepID=A0ABP8GQ51_9BURK
MTAYSVFETFVVVAIVAACLFTAFGKLAPRARASLLAGAGAWLERPGHPGWAQALGRRWARKPAAAGGCDSGCSTCGSCETPSADHSVIHVDLPHGKR